MLAAIAWAPAGACGAVRSLVYLNDETRGRPTDPAVIARLNRLATRSGRRRLSHLDRALPAAAIAPERPNRRRIEFELIESFRDLATRRLTARLDGQAVQLHAAEYGLLGAIYRRAVDTAPLSLRSSEPTPEVVEPEVDAQEAAEGEYDWTSVDGLAFSHPTAEEAA